MYGEKLKYLREEKELKQYELEPLLLLGKDMYGQYEREAQTIPIKHLLILCDFYDVSLDYIFSFTNIRQYKNNNNINSNIAILRLKDFRKENKLTQKKLAAILNASFTTISSYERGVVLIATNYLYTICKKYGISADYLLGKTNSPKYFHWYI